MSENNLLNESLCYLIGAIDNASDLGSGWRKQLIDSCKAFGLNIKFLDPTKKVTGLQSENTEERNLIVKLKREKKWDELRDFMKRIVREDHRSVDLSDFVIVYLDPSVHTCGSYFELQSALSQKKPYFIVANGGKKNMPSWLFGICDHSRFFESMEDVVNELVLLNQGTIPMSDRWVLFRKQIKEL